MTTPDPDPDTGDGAVLVTDGRHVPHEIRTDPIWVLWDLRAKVPRAPWHTGNCYRVKWNADLGPDERPEIDYDEAAMFAELPPSELHETHPFPTTTEDGTPIENPIPEQVEATLLLPPEGDGADLWDGRVLMYIDLDDIRDPESGAVTDEVREIVARLDSYTEISSSGTGLHILVWARLPDALGAVDGDPLGTIGSIEMYDHGRFFGGTWRHVDGTPTTISKRQAVVDELIAEYVPDDRLSDPGTTGATTSGDSHESADTAGGGGGGSNGGAPEGDRSPYYDVPLTTAAPPDPENRTSTSASQGAHPDHGKTTEGDPGDCTNYIIDTDGNRWHCFAHNSGGGAMEMAAIRAGHLGCRHAGQGTLRRLSDDAFLRTCFYARDYLDGFEDDMTPPYRALVALADILDLAMRDPDERILGRMCYDLATHAYDTLDATDLDDA